MHGMSLLYRIYFAITFLMQPFLPLLLRYRLRKGKEDATRLHERYGKARVARPEGKLLWIHAASMGESASVLPLMEAFLQQYPAWQVMVTTVTVTSAAQMAAKLPPRAFHQFAPLDTPQNIHRFLHHWQPDAALWVESELWPNAIIQTAQYGCPLFLLNARLSERSAQRWQYAPSLCQHILSSFQAVYPQSHEDAKRLAAFTPSSLTAVEYLGNLKCDVPALTADETELQNLRTAIGNRPLWLAASTHDGEEESIAVVHQRLRAVYPDLLTILIPRHAVRGDAIVAFLRAKGLYLSQRSQHEPLTAETALYVADTMGELGLFYRLAPIAFIGGSLIPHGGQNPLEAARLHTALLCGTHTHNFTAIVAELRAASALAVVQDAEELYQQLAFLLANPQAQAQRAEAAFAVVQQQGGAINAVLERIGKTAIFQEDWQ
jgi:3-deoxy-D-manno-octulosonic-acid transferase